MLDTHITPELLEKGFVREVISKLQTMRKDSGFEVTDRIHVIFTGDDELAEALEANAEMICRTTLALSLERKAAQNGFVTKTWDINGKKAELGIRKA